VIQETGTLDDTRKQALHQTLQGYVRTIMPAASPQNASPPASQP
jgi:hypothetical protein